MRFLARGHAAVDKDEPGGRGLRWAAWSTVGAVLAVSMLGAAPAVAAAHVTVTRVVAHAAPATVQADTVLVVSGSVSPRTTTPVVLQRQVGTAWRAVSRATLAAHGTGFSASVRAPKSAGAWVLRVARTGSSAVSAGVSAALHVRVVKSAFVVHAAAVTPVTAGSALVVTGSVAPRATGSVMVQRLVGTAWTAFGSAKLSATSTFWLPLVRPKGSYRLRVLKAFTATVAGGTSRPVSVTVVAPPVTVTPPTAPPVVATTSLPAGRVGVAYAATLTATGGVGPYAWSSSALPAGLVLAATGALSGAPKAAGTTAVTMTVTDAAGRSGTAALTVSVAPPAGPLWAWGQNTSGQLGNGSTTNTSVLVPVSGMTSVTAVASDGDSGYALTTDSTVWAWGSNTAGALGNGSASDSSVPVQVTGLTSVTAIAAAAESGYALRSDGTVWAWGYDGAGDLGNGSTTDSGVPVQVTGLTSVTAIAGRTATAYALRSDGTVWAWGNNASGQLGNGSTTSSDVPVEVTGLTSVIAIAAGGSSGYALRSDGTVWDWGLASDGELGSGPVSHTVSEVPLQVSGLTSVTAISAGAKNGYALRSDGTVWAWGYSTDGELGNGQTVSNAVVPVQVSGLTSVTAIAGGASSGYALRADGYVWAWGWNYFGQLGNGTTTDSDSPVQASGLTGVIAVASGGHSGYAIEAG